MNDLSNIDEMVNSFFKDQKPRPKLGRVPVAIKRSPYKGELAQKAIGRVWIVRGNKEKAFASEESANAFAAGIVARLRNEMLTDNIHQIEPEQVPEPTPKNFREVMAILADQFGWGKPDFVNIIEMGVFA